MSENMFDKEGELGGVLGQVSGQLRSSLGNIYSALSRIAPPELREGDSGVDLDAAVLCQSYYRILRLANNLSDAAGLEGPNTAVLRNVDIVELCRSVIERAQLPARLLDIRLSFRCGEDHHIIAADSERIERLLMNLLSNAFKFIRQDQREVSLEVRVGRQRVDLVLADTGCGIPAEMMETVFERYRQDPRLDPPPHGLGLGLPICRRIAQDHGGALVLTSRVGEGTTVTVSLPNRRSRSQSFREPAMDLGGGFNRTLAGLADALPKQAFTQKYLD